MKKNNKGFTLVELLAALVILGLLVALTMPTILNLLSNNRDKVYVSDAKKLIARAEYKIRASSSVIEKPDSDSNDCIVISLVFLNNSDFNTPPNNGKYLEEASFVVIRFVNNKLEYSATLVEEMKKGGYRGVELTKDVNLVSNSTKHVVNFDKSDLIFVENNDMSKKYGGNIVSDNFINSKLGTNYVGNISNIYNYPDLADSVSNSTYSIPKIERASMKSASNKDYNTLNAQLTLVVADADTPLSQLKVYIGFNDYPDYTKVFTQNTGANNIDTFDKFRDTMFAYGNNSYFSLTFNFAKYNKTYNGEVVNIYIVVVDPQGNFAKRVIRYKLYSNQAPVISKDSTITRRPQDNYNMNETILYAPIFDDIDDNENIQVCVTDQSTDYSYCKDESLWSYYSDLFNSDNKMNFNFSCPAGGCVYDGSIKQIAIFAKDSYGVVSTNILNYQFFSNSAPIVNKCDVISKKLSFNGEKNALEANVKFSVTDENVEDVNISISDDENFVKNVVSGKYSDFSSGNGVNFNFEGIYDGADRYLHYKLDDVYGAVQTGVVLYDNIYANVAPDVVVTNNSIKSKDINTYVCPNTGNCDSSNGGAYETEVNFSIYDDLTSTHDILYCISENKSDCTTYNSSKFSPYEPGETVDYTFASPSSGNKYNLNDAETAKKLYISAYDNYGSSAAISDVKELDYTLYKDVAPIVSKLDINPDGNLNNKDVFNPRNIQLLLYATDDIDSPSNLTYSITESRAGSSDITKTGKLSECSKSSDGSYIIDYVISGKYDGGSVTFNASVTDSSGNTGSLAEPLEYTIYQNEKPIITNFSIESSRQPCLSDSGFCTTYGNKDVNISFTTSDDLTATNNLDVAIIDGNTSGCSSATYTKFKDLNFVNGKIAHSLPVSNADMPYNGSTKTVSICVKDEDGGLSYQSNTYTLYENKVVRFNTGYPKIENYKYNPNNTNYNLKQFTYKLEVTDDFISPSDYASNFKMDVCYKVGDSDVEHCTPKMAYQSSYTMTLPENATYDGTTYYIFSHVYDSYDAPATSSQLIYTIYNDTHPQISNFDIEANVGTRETYDVKLNFTVNDMFDTYTYCVSDTGECTDYSSTPLDGYCSDNTSCNLSHEYIYHTNWATNVKDDHFVNLFVKDSHGNVDVSTIQVTYADGDEEKHLCEQTSPLNITMTLRDDIENNDDISADRCNNRCYYWGSELDYNDDVKDYVEKPNSGSITKDIHTFYSRHEVSHDLRHTKVLCKDDTNTEFPVYCDFYKCFKNPNLENNYAVKAIGMKLIESEAWTHSGPDGQHTNTSYYRVYTSVYDAAADNKITFNRNGTTKICPQCLDNDGDNSFDKATYSEANFGHFVIIDDRTFEGE